MLRAIRNLFLAVGAVAFVAGGAACGGGGSDGKVHRRVVQAKVKGFDPAGTGDQYSGNCSMEIYEPLYEVHFLKRPVEMVPLTAAALPEISDDGLTYTITMKPGIRFHDDACFPDGKGRELVAQDYIYSWKRVADPKVQSELWGFFQGWIAGLDEFREKAGAAPSTDYDAEVAGLQAPDAHTLVITLTKRNPFFKWFLIMPFTAAVPREAVEKYGDDFTNKGVGTGAFMLKEWVRDSRIVLVRNPNYHPLTYPTEGEPAREGFPGDAALGRLKPAGRTLPLCDRIELDIIVEDQPRWLQFVTGAADVSTIPKDSFDQAFPGGEMTPELKAQGVEVEVVPLLDVTYTSFNMTDPILGKNKKLRRAMAMAHNMQEVSRLFYNDRVTLAESPVPPGMFGYDPAFKNPYQRFDLEAAKKLMAEAGYPNGEGLPELVLDTGGSSKTSREMAELFREEMSKIGVKIRIEINTWPELIEKINARKTQIFGIAWGADYPDAENFLQLFYGPNSAPAGQNNACYQNPEFDELFKQQLEMPSNEARYKILRRMVDIVCEDNVWIMGVHRQSWVMRHPWCPNYKRDLVGGWNLKHIDVDVEERLKRIGR